MMYLKTAKPIADRIVMLLQSHCDIINIAGSIRREKQIVKDIEIVCIPKKEFIQTDLLGGGITKVVPGFTDALTTMQEKIIKGNPEGRYMQIILKGGAIMDMFMPQPHDYYRQLSIRTGSAEYASFVIANGWKRKGWCGTHDGLRMQSQCLFNEKTNNWKCVVKEPTLPPVWQSEQEFFEWLGVPYVHPSKREIPSTINQYQ